MNKILAKKCCYSSVFALDNAWLLLRQQTCTKKNYLHSAYDNLIVNTNQLFGILLVAFLKHFCQIQVFTNSQKDAYI